MHFQLQQIISYDHSSLAGKSWHKPAGGASQCLVVKSKRPDGWQKEGKLLAVGPLHCAPLHLSPEIQMSQNMPFIATGYMCYAQYYCFDSTDSNFPTLYMCNSLDGSLVQWFC